MSTASYFLIVGLLVFVYGTKHAAAKHTYAYTNAKAAYGLFGGALIVVIAVIYLIIGSSIDQMRRVLSTLGYVFFWIAVVAFPWWSMRKEEKRNHRERLQKAITQARQVASVRWRVICTYFHSDGVVRYRITSEDGSRSLVLDPTGHADAEQFKAFRAGTALQFQLAGTPEKSREYDYLRHLRINAAH